MAKPCGWGAMNKNMAATFRLLKNAPKRNCRSCKINYPVSRDAAWRQRPGDKIMSAAIRTATVDFQGRLPNIMHEYICFIFRSHFDSRLRFVHNLRRFKDGSFANETTWQDNLIKSIVLLPFSRWSASYRITASASRCSMYCPIRFCSYRTRPNSTHW